MPRYFLRVSLEHLSFRIPELMSIGELFGFQIDIVGEYSDRGVLIIDVEKEEHMEKILDRAILVQSANLLYAHATTYEDLHAQVQKRMEEEDLLQDVMGKSWKITVDGVNNRITDKRMRQVVNGFAYTKLDGKISLKEPEVELVVLEEYELVTVHSREARLARDGSFRQVFFGRRVGLSRARPLINTFDIKQRTFFGNTSMESEVGLLMAGQALPAPGKLMYDPFLGTGSCLYGVAHWGALVMGSDIDARQFRGKEKGKDVVPGIIRSARQYGVDHRFVGNICFDITQAPWRRGGFLDAIITDPPYGVRAGAKRQGKSATRKRNVLREEPFVMPDGTFAHENPAYVPPSKPYELVDLAYDLVLLARYLLVPGGRLVFFLPTVHDDYDEVDIPVVEGMEELKWGNGSVQSFGQWGRRLITMVKTAQDDGPPPTFGDHSDVALERLPGHHKFAKRYFEGFTPREGSGESTPEPELEDGVARLAV